MLGIPTLKTKMIKPHDIDRLIRIYEFIKSNPGTSQYAIAEGLELRPNAVYRSLPALEENGFLIYEDRGGLLYPLSRQD